MSDNIYNVGLTSESRPSRKKTPTKSLSKSHECWKGEKHKPREVMTTKLPAGRSRGVWASYCKVVNGKVVNVE